MSSKQLLTMVFVSLFISVIVVSFGIFIYHNFLISSLPNQGKSTSTPRETNIAPNTQADDRIDYACSGETQTCEEGFKQQCIYVTCLCDDGFKPHGEVDGCVDISLKKPEYKKVDDELIFTERGLQYAFSGECAQICRQVGH